jgi:hypothetical protein
MFGLLGGFVTSAISGIITPLFAFLNKKQDTQLAEYQAMTAAERDGYDSYVRGLSDSNQAKIENNKSSAAHFMIYLFGLPAAIHWNAVFWITTCPSLFHWLGIDTIAGLPKGYESAEMTIALSFFILAPAMPIVSSVSDMISRRGQTLPR